MINYSPESMGLVLISLLVIGFSFSNGFRDSSTLVATVVSTRALSANKAFFLCAVSEFLGALFIGSAVAATVGKSLFAVGSTVASEMPIVLAAGLLGSIIWGGVSWWRAWPISNSQALFAGLAGAGLASWGAGSLNGGKIVSVFVILLAAPVVGFIVSACVTKSIRIIGQWMTPQVIKPVQRLHILSFLMVSCVHGSNDGQIVMGLLILAYGSLQVFSPAHSAGFWDTLFIIRLVIALNLACGMLLGGKRLLKRLGMKFYQIKPHQGLGAQMTAAATILTCNLAGYPASAMQVITGSIIGAGVAKSHKAVRWHVAEEVLISWIITLPAVGLLSFLLFMLLSLI